MKASVVALQIAGYAWTLPCFSHISMDVAAARQFADFIETAMTKVHEINAEAAQPLGEEVEQPA